jgi:hypothetical protein
LILGIFIGWRFSHLIDDAVESFNENFK